MVISRAGANSIFEFLSINLPMLLIPLPKSQSRGDQIENAKYFEKKGYCHVMMDEELDSNKFIDKIYETYSSIDKIKNNMKKQKELGNINEMVNKIISLTKK